MPVPAVGAAASPCGITFAHAGTAAIASTDRSLGERGCSSSMADPARIRPSIPITDSRGKTRHFHAVGSHRVTRHDAADTVEWPQGGRSGIGRSERFARGTLVPTRGKRVRRRPERRRTPPLAAVRGTADAGERRRRFPEPGRTLAPVRRDAANGFRRVFACEAPPRARGRAQPCRACGTPASPIANRQSPASRRRAAQVSRHATPCRYPVRRPGDSDAMIEGADGASAGERTGNREAGRATHDAAACHAWTTAPPAGRPDPAPAGMPSRDPLACRRRGDRRVRFAPVRTRFDLHHHKDIP